MPLLASASAHAQGRALVEICTVYGVASVASVGRGALDDHGSEDSDGSSDSAAHRPQHCALTALLAWSAPELQQHVWRITPRQPDRATHLRVATAAPPVDACAAWVAQLRHGPPTGA